VSKKSGRGRATRSKKGKSLVSKRLEQAVLLVILLSLPFLLVKQISPTGLTVSEAEIPTLAYSGPSEIVFHEKLTMDLSRYFEGDLTYLATTAEALDVHVDDHVLTVTASEGTHEITLIASDGESTVRIPINLTADILAEPTPIAYPLELASFFVTDELGIEIPATIDVNSRTVSLSYQPVGGRESYVVLFNVTPFSISNPLFIGPSSQNKITTDIVSLENIEISRAEIVLSKKSDVGVVYRCESLDIDLFICDEWITTEIPFEQNETHVWFVVDSVDAYAGGELSDDLGGESQILAVPEGGGDSTFVDVNSCGKLTQNSTVTADVSSTGTCFDIIADGAVLDCAGFTISYDSSGAGNGYGVNVTGRKQVTVKNCFIRDIDIGGIFGFGIFLNTTNDSIVLNNTIQTNGTQRNDGIRLQAGSHNNTVTNNTIRAEGTSSVNVGIHLISSSQNTISKNNIRTNGTIVNVGIRLFTSASNNTIVNNTINSDGVGIQLVTSTLNIISENTIQTNGTSSTTEGIVLSTASGNIISKNKIQTLGANNVDGIFIAASNNNTFIDNNITTNGTDSYGIRITSSSNLSFLGTRLIRPVEWIISETSTNLNNFTNTTFVTENGSIQINSSFNITGRQNINHSTLNISQNRAFLNTTALTFMNTSAQITLNDISFEAPIIKVDFDDGSGFGLCTPPQCVNESYDGSTFVFNVSSFTSYIAAEIGTPVIASVVLNSTFNSNFTGENLTAFVIDASDADGDDIKNITNWFVNGSSIMVLNMPFEGGSTSGVPGSNGTTKDYSPVGNTAEVVNATFNSTGGIDGFGAYLFDGNGDFITVKHNESLNPADGNIYILSVHGSILNPLTQTSTHCSPKTLPG